MFSRRRQQAEKLRRLEAQKLEAPRDVPEVTTHAPVDEGAVKAAAAAANDLPVLKPKTRTKG